MCTPRAAEASAAPPAAPAARPPRLVAAAAAAAPLRLAPALWAPVPPAQCGALLQALSREAPLPRAQAHLRRVWRFGPGSSCAEGPPELRVLFALAEAEAGPLEALAERFGLGALRRTQVPLLPPSGAADAAAWSALHWPCVFNAAAAAAAAAAAPTQGHALPAEEVAAMRAGMARARALAAAAAAAGGACNGALIVDPSSGEVVAEGRDVSRGCGGGGGGWRGGGEGGHPLRHAVMAALDAAARRDLALYHAPSTAEAAAAARGEGGKRKEPPDAPPRPYLCTGWDCFVLSEPCLMCAMALVHSRVRRVVFARPDCGAGALGGRWALQALRSLNHHYAVYCLDEDAVPPDAAAA